MSRERIALLNRGLVGGGVIAAMVMLAMFYSVVSGAAARAGTPFAQAAQAASVVAAEVAAKTAAGADRRASLFAGTTE